MFCLSVSDNTSRASNIPLVTPASLLLLARGRVALMQNHAAAGFGVPLYLTGYLAPEYRPNKYRTDIETEKVGIFDWKFIMDKLHGIAEYVRKICHKNKLNYQSAILKNVLESFFLKILKHKPPYLNSNGENIIFLL